MVSSTTKRAVADILGDFKDPHTRADIVMAMLKRDIKVSKVEILSTIEALSREKSYLCAARLAEKSGMILYAAESYRTAGYGDYAVELAKANNLHLGPVNPPNPGNISVPADLPERRISEREMARSSASVPIREASSEPLAYDGIGNHGQQLKPEDIEPWPLKVDGTIRKASPVADAGRKTEGHIVADWGAIRNHAESGNFAKAAQLSLEAELYPHAIEYLIKTGDIENAIRVADAHGLSAKCRAILLAHANQLADSGWYASSAKVMERLGAAKEAKELYLKQMAVYSKGKLYECAGDIAQQLKMMERAVQFYGLQKKEFLHERNFTEADRMGERILEICERYPHLRAMVQSGG